MERSTVENGSVRLSVIADGRASGDATPILCVHGVGMFAQAGAACDDVRGSTSIEGVGHWVRQEAPEQTNAALEPFLDGL